MMWMCVGLLVLGHANDVSETCAGNECDVQMGQQEFVQLRRHRREGSEIPGGLCVENITDNGESTHRIAGNVANEATLFTVNNEIVLGRRMYMPNSIFQPSALNENDDPASIPPHETGALPEAREVSVRVLRKPRNNPPLSDVLNVMTMTFGQFIDHDIALVEEHFDDPPHLEVELCNRTANPTGFPGIPPEQGCDSGCTMERFPAVCQTTDNGRQSLAKINQVAGFLEGHNVYGTTQHRQDTLRNWMDGRLVSQMRKDGASKFELPPFRIDVADDDDDTDDVAGGPPPCGSTRVQSNASLNFLCGDIRCTENTPLLAMHTLWLREHNRLTDVLRESNVNKLPRGKMARDQYLYTHARAMVVARIQSVLMYEFLPAVLGQARFDDLVGPYTGYNEELNPSISDAFAAAFYRFGHTLIPDAFNFEKHGVSRQLGLVDAQFNAGIAVDESGILDELLRGEVQQQAEEVDVFLADGVRDDLFNERRDLAALNIARSRDHQVAFYAQMRIEHGLSAVTEFTDPIFSNAPEGTVEALTELYQTPDRCDVFVCMLAENKVEGSQVGELLGTVLAKEYRRMRDGDQMWFENTEIWNEDFIAEIRRNRMTDVMRNNLIGAESFPEGVTNAFLRENFVN